MQGVNTTQVYFRGEHSGQVQAYGDETAKIMTYFRIRLWLAAAGEFDAGRNGSRRGGRLLRAWSYCFSRRASHQPRPPTYACWQDQLSRQWWGVLVSPSNRNHLWLENGPARFSQLLYIEQHGRPRRHGKRDLRNTTMWKP